jgi:hypothetical protein
VEIIALALEDRVRPLDDLQEQVAGWPAPGPTSPSPASWMWVPSSTPAGILTLMVRRVRTRPSASHSGHGRRMIVP